jgi:hypothetical protein
MRGTLVRRVAVVSLVGSSACAHRDSALPPDASTPSPDAPAACTQVARGPQPACMALQAAQLQGESPYGVLDLELGYFGAGDCVTIANATVLLHGACGEELTVRFPYPVVQEAGARRVPTSFDADAAFSLRVPGQASAQTTGAVHVEVRTWQEQADAHDIDVTLTITDAAFAVAPLHIQGTFCDWPYYICSGG